MHTWWARLFKTKTYSSCALVALHSVGAASFCTGKWRIKNKEGVCRHVRKVRLKRLLFMALPIFPRAAREYLLMIYNFMVISLSLSRLSACPVLNSLWAQSNSRKSLCLCPVPFIIWNQPPKTWSTLLTP